MTTSPSQFFAQLICDYLAAVDGGGARAPGLPAPGVCGIVTATPVEEKDRPVISVAAMERKGSRGGRREVTVMAILKVWLMSDAQVTGGLVAKRTTHEQACAWVKAIDDRLQDLAALNAWVAALPEERRAGWKLLKVIPQGEMPATRTRDDDDRDYSYPVGFDLVVAVYGAV